MKEKVLFEIPIYSTSKENFDKKWDKVKEQTYEDFISHGHTEESAKKYSRSLYFPQSIWKYNHIVGYITIVVTENDFIFETYRCADTRYYFNTKTKHFIQYSPINGMHFYTGSKSDDEIEKEILSFLTEISEKFIPKRFFVDFSVYDNLICYVDIREFIDNTFEQ